MPQLAKNVDKKNEQQHERESGMLFVVTRQKREKYIYLYIYDAVIAIVPEEATAATSLTHAFALPAAGAPPGHADVWPCKRFQRL